MGRDIIPVVTLLIVLVALIGFLLVLLCIIFNKAGEKAWKAIVPFYNQYILYKIVWGNGWLFLTLFIPFGGDIFSLVTIYKLARVFGKGRFLSIMMLFIPFIPMAMIAFGDVDYLGSSKKNLTSGLVVSIIVGVIVAIGCGFMLHNVIHKASVTFENASNTAKEFNEYFERNLDIYRKSYDYYENHKGIEVEDDVKVETPEESKKVKLPERADSVVLEYYDGYKVEVPVLKDSDLDVSGSNAYYFLDDGTSVSVSLVNTSNDMESSLNSYIESQKSLVEEMDFYESLEVQEISRKENSVCQRLRYNYKMSDGLYPMEFIVKVEDLGNDYYVTYSLEKDGYVSESKDEWNKVLDIYGIGVTD